MFDDLVREWRESKSAMIDAKQRFAEAEKALTDAMNEAKEKSVIIEVDEREYRVTGVFGEQTRYLPDRMQLLLGRVKFRRLCRLVPDSGLIEQAVVAGEITNEQLADCVEFVPKKPYVLMSLVGEEQ